MALVKVDEENENKRKRTLGDLTVDIAPRPLKRTKLIPMSESESKVGKIDEETVMIYILYPCTVFINTSTYIFRE